MDLSLNTPARNEQFPALTGIRAIAAFMVFFNHLPLHIKPDFLVGIQLTFYWGVTLFFVLSGFLITYRYYESMQLSRKWAWKYVVNRFARIYPVYFLLLTIVLLILKKTDPVYLLQNYTLTHNLFFLFESRGIAIGPSWSLTVEECFYLLAPFIFLLTRRFTLWVPFILTILLALLLVFTFEGGGGPMLDLFAIAYATFFGHAIEFFAGMFLALYLLKRKKTGVKHATKTHYTLTAMILIGIVMIPLVYATNQELDLKNSIMMIGNNLLLPVPIALLYYGLIMEKTWLRNFLSLSYMQFMGKASYCFYLMHLPLIYYFGKPYLEPYLGEANYNIYVASMFILSVILSALLYHFFEHPLNAYIRRVAKT